MKRLISLFLCLAMLLAFTACGEVARPKETDETTTASVPETSAGSTEPATTAPIELPPVEVELVVNDAQLTYEMTDGDFEEFYDLLSRSEELTLVSEDWDAVDQLTTELDDKYAYLEAQHSIAMILYYCDLENEEASQLYLDVTEQVTQANNDYLEMLRRVYQSDAPTKDKLFEDWSEQELAMLLAYTDEIMKLQQRNSEIEVAYQDTQNSDTMYDDMVPLYLELVQNNNRIAQIYGFDHYYTYAYQMGYERDYGPEEVAAMRGYASEYLPGVLEGALEDFSTSMENLGQASYQKLYSFLFESYENGFEDSITGYLGTLPQQAREDMLDMFDGNILMLDGVDTAMEGAFTAAIGEDRSVCFFGPGYSSPMTIIHEVGHYYGSKHVYLNDLPLDLAETQSQGNEWLFLSYMKDDMRTTLYNTTVGYKTFSDLAMILLCVAIDEFEERVYTHPDVASLTGDDLDAIMEEVCENYGGIDFLNNNVTDVQEYWRMVVVEQPVYYISYAVSAIAAMNIYTIAQEDYTEAARIYCSLIEEADVDQGFLANIKNAGLDGPFDEEVYLALAEKYN